MDRTFKRERPAPVEGAPKAGVSEDRYEDLEISGLREELERTRYNRHFYGTLYAVAGAILVVTALIILITKQWMPVVRVTDNQMSPTLAQGQKVTVRKADKYKPGDIIAFYNNHRILVRRVIACEGDWVNIAADGTVFVNDVAIEESYIEEKSQGDCSAIMPCKVLKGSYFVLSDNRGETIDSRDSAVGCVAEGQVIGRVKSRVWPLSKLGRVN